MGLTRRLVPVACLVALAAGLTGCGGSGSGSTAVSAKAYVTSVCKAVGPFEHDIATSSSALEPSAGSSPAEVKRILEGFLTTIAIDSRSAVQKLKAARHPDVHDGTAIAGEFVMIFTRIEDAMRSAARSSRTLPTSSPLAFKAADAKLGKGVEQSVVGDLGSGLTVLRNRALETAAAAVPACRTLS